MDRLSAMMTFVAVVEAGSFTRATDGVRLSKPAVSRQISELEHSLGVRLLQRTTRKLSLTTEGEGYYQRCKEIIAAVEEAESEIGQARGEARGRLRVGAPQSFGVLHLAPLWGEFLKLNPELTLDITLSDRVVDLIEEGYDMAIRIARMPSSTLITRALATTELVLCASPDYLARRGTPLEPADIRHHDAITYSYLASGTEWQLLTASGEAVNVQTKTRIFANNGDTCRSIAIAGQGIVLQPDFMVYEDLRQGTLVRLLPDYKTPTLTIYAVYPTRKMLPPRVRNLLNFLVAALRSPSWKTAAAC